MPYRNTQDMTLTRRCGTLLNTLGATYRDLPSAKICVKESTSPGKLQLANLLLILPPDTLGKPVSLSSFKGKYVLIDFWASGADPVARINRMW